MGKKLIEVALPLEAINAACVEDKDRKTGHIRNLHKCVENPKPKFDGVYSGLYVFPAMTRGFVRTEQYAAGHRPHRRETPRKTGRASNRLPP